jgi:hypothetical protein
MKQFEFEMINKQTKRVEHARATAINEVIARAQIVIFYGRQFDVLGLCSDVNPAHYVLGEIDASSSPVTDTAWLTNEANKIEGVSI